MTHTELWKAALGQIELSLSKANFVTWFKNTSILSFENGIATINVPNGFAKEWLENKYNLYILKALKSLDPTTQEIRCIISQNNNTQQNNQTVKRLDAIQGGISAQAGAFTRKKIPNEVSLSRNSGQNSVFESHLNPRYTFDNFIVAENNELARAACFAVSQNLGHLYNPLFIYGGVGLGKTHLLQGLGNEIMRQHSDKRVKYITSERFTTELVDSIKNQTIDQFKRTYEEIDLLIIDDIQFLSGREKTQNEFFHIFNALYQLNKQIVISSDRPPKAIPTLEERLRSRFEGGMIADISKPSLETRIAILETKAKEKGIALDSESIQFIATHITQNIRELEGALSRIMAYSEFQKVPLTLSLVQKVLGELITRSKKNIKQEDILRVIMDFYGISENDLVKKGRKKEVAHPRQIAMYLMRTELDTPLSSIGEFFGGRDHTTVLHAVEKIERIKETNLRIKEEIMSLRDRLQV
ncbi:MAG: chromosomal replication initiator protein DnaA [Candidatus Moraniibacteriota bacterium]